MIKPLTLIFVLFFGILLGVEKCDGALVAAVFVTWLGTVLTSVGGDGGSFNIIGFLFIVAATASAGFRWAMSQASQK